MLHIYGHTWPVRWGDESEEKEILVYSNEPEVELFVNGVSAGKRKLNSQDYPAQGFHWNVFLQKGHNTVKACSKTLTDEISFEYQTEKWGTPARIRLSIKENDLVEAQIVDMEGRCCLDSRDWIEFSIAGGGRLLHNQGTATGSARIQAANGRAAIRLIEVKGPCVVSAQSPHVPTALLNIP
jgi:beta-galactosidase